MPAPNWAAGPVTRLGLPPVAAPPAGAQVAPAGPPVPPGSASGGRNRRTLWWFGGAAGVLLAAGLAVVLGLVFSQNPDPFRRPPANGPDVRPPLARLCPPPAETAPPAEASPPAAPPAQSPAPADPADPPAGEERTVDPAAGISYAAYGPPWQPWDAVWRAGTLEVPYRVGQHFVTEPAYNGFSDYHASILSGAVPAAENDGLALDLECVGRQVAADVRAEYYPQPNRMELLRDERVVVGGLSGWVTVFRLHFSRSGLRATDELAGVLVLDVGRPTAAVLYVSIPGTHRELDPVVERTLASVRPA